MQNINKTPVIVDVNVERITTNTSAFYTVGFVCETTLIDQPLTVKTLNDLLDVGFLRSDTAYNFCLGVFAQKKMQTVVIIPKQKEETYVDSYKNHETSTFYYVCLETKNIEEILDLYRHLKSTSDNKLLFFSHIINYEKEVEGLDLVYYYEQPLDVNKYLEGVPEFTLNNPHPKYIALYPYEKAYIDYIDTSIPTRSSTETRFSQSEIFWAFDDSSKLYWDNAIEAVIAHEFKDFTQDEAQGQMLAYPEAAWIGYCGWYFPSHVQWAYKTLNKVRETTAKLIPSNATCSTRLMFNERATTDYAATASGVKIEQYVSLAWLKAAIEWNIWQTLLKSETKITFSKNGDDLLESKLREVLEFAVSENIFTDYNITERSFNTKNYTASYKFSATLTHSILGVDKVEGTIYH